MKKTVFAAVLASMMGAAMSFGVSAAVVEPQQSVDLGSEDFGNGMYHVGFNQKDVTAQEIFADIYEEASFDIVDIGKLSVGDTIVSADGDVEVKTIDRTDNGIEINGGYEEGGVSLRTYEDTNGWFETMLESQAYILRGQAQLTLADEVVLNVFKQKEDGRPDQGYDTYTCKAEEFGDVLEEAGKSYGTYSPSRVVVTLEEDLVTEVTISYAP